MPQQRMRADPELDPNHIEVWNDRTGRANANQSGGESILRQDGSKSYGHNRVRQH